MVDKIPSDGDRVEILVDGVWIEATFYDADYFYDDDDGGGDEVWWMDHFLLDDGVTTIPDNIQSGSKLPEWRRKEGVK